VYRVGNIEVRIAEAILSPTPESGVRDWIAPLTSVALDRNTYLLSGRFPWKGAVASLAVAAVMLIASVKVLQEREF